MSDEMKKLTQDVQDRVRETAYLLWEAAGKPIGMAMQFWLEAEKQVLQTMRAATDAILPSSRRAKPKATESEAPKPMKAALARPEAKPAAPAPAAPSAPKAAAPAPSPPKAAAPAPAPAARSGTTAAAKPAEKAAAKKPTTRGKTKG
jgi:hypothetical protein